MVIYGYILLWIYDLINAYCFPNTYLLMNHLLFNMPESFTNLPLLSKVHFKFVFLFFYFRNVRFCNVEVKTKFMKSLN